MALYLQEKRWFEELELYLWVLVKCSTPGCIVFVHCDLMITDALHNEHRLLQVQHSVDGRKKSSQYAGPMPKER